jgi:hypothetical protein
MARIKFKPIDGSSMKHRIKEPSYVAKTKRFRRFLIASVLLNLILLGIVVINRAHIHL